MRTLIQKRECPTCGQIINGRADKKYCNDTCRNGFNNGLKYTDKQAYIRRINNVLGKNRRILKTILQNATNTEKVTLHKNQLIELGFNFQYFTNLLITKREHTYRFCYDYGYMELENDRYLVVKWSV